MIFFLKTKFVRFYNFHFLFTGMAVTNPWHVDSIQVFLVLKCPECMFTSKEEHTFQDHAIRNHPMSSELFGKTFFNDSETREVHNDLFLESIFVKLPDENSSKQTVSTEDESVVTSLTKAKNSCFRKRHKCSHCDISFKRENSLKQHLEIQHGNESLQKVDTKCFEEELKVYQCSECNGQYKSMAGVTDHIARIHEGKKPLECTDCQFTVTKTSNLKKHIETVHEGIKPFKCEICEIRFAHKSGYKYHVTAIHDKKKPFQCVECDATFAGKGSLKSHFDAVHEGKKPNKCPFCESTFHQKGTLKLHIVSVHEKKKPNQCSLCDKTFAIKHQLSRHIKTVHEGDKPFLCGCGSRFSSNGNLKAHIVTVHEKKKPYECSICGLGFVFPNYLQRHIKTVHDREKPFACDLCGSKFGNKGNLNVHLKMHEKNKASKDMENHQTVLVATSLQEKQNAVFLESIKLS